MSNSTRRRLTLVWLLLAVALSLLASPTVRAQDLIPLDEALAQNLVTVEVVASSSAFGELSLTLRPTDGELLVGIPVGTRFIPDSATLSEVVTVQAVDVWVRSETQIDPLHVATLYPNRSLPSPMSAVDYAVAGVVDGRVLELLGRLQSLLQNNDQAAHLALWAVHEGRSAAEIDAELNVPLGAEVVARAEELAAGAQPPPPGPDDENDPDGETGRPTQTPDPGQPVSDSGSFPLGWLLLILLVLLGGAVVIAVLAQRIQQRKTPIDEYVSPAPPDSGDRNKNRPDVAGSGKPRKTDTDKPRTTSTDASTGYFVGTDGPHSGRRLDISGAVIIARSPIKVQALSQETISSPHVYLEWRPDGVDVKDLNSEDGTELNGQQLSDAGKQRASFGDTITLSGRMKVQINLDGVQVGGKLYKRGDSDSLILSRENLRVLSLGYDDTAISDPHCLIRRNRNDYTIRDLNSSNGVLIDGERLGQGETPMATGATLRLGHSTFTRSGD